MRETPLSQEQTPYIRTRNPQGNSMSEKNRGPIRIIWSRTRRSTLRDTADPRRVKSNTEAQNSVKHRHTPNDPDIITNSASETQRCPQPKRNDTRDRNTTKERNNSGLHTRERRHAIQTNSLNSQEERKRNQKKEAKCWWCSCDRVKRDVFKARPCGKARPGEDTTDQTSQTRNR